MRYDFSTKRRQSRAGSTYVFGSKVGLEEVPSVGHVGSVNGCKWDDIDFRSITAIPQAALQSTHARGPKAR